MLPRLNKWSILDEVFDDQFFNRKNNTLMKTDVKEKNGNYILDIDVPGYDKENIEIELENGYLTVTASKTEEKSDSSEQEKYIHKERFYGKCSRNYYTGENITEEDIHATFKNGILTIEFPKEVKQESSNKKIIEISD